MIKMVLLLVYSIVSGIRDVFVLVYHIKGYIRVCLFTGM